MTLTMSLATGAFAVGLLGGVHCVGMCGGIVAGLNGAGTGQRSAHVSFNLGRILSYAVAGAIAGTLGGLGFLMERIVPIQVMVYMAANLLLVGLGLYLAGWSGVVTWLERPGRWVWRQLQPALGRILPVKNWRGALALGMVWGWVPCGLVYSVLASALLTGTPFNGVTVMLAFGLGTFPNLLITGLFAHQFRRKLQVPAVRMGAGLLVVALGLFGLSRAFMLSPEALSSLICSS